MREIKYCLDTSVFIESWRQYYAPDVFPTLWRRLSEGLQAGILVSSDVVLQELSRKDDDIYQWCRQFPESFIEASESIQLGQQHIVSQFTRMVAEGKMIGSSYADPWVVATGIEVGCSIVSFERLPASEQKPKIPYVCKELGVQHKTLLEVMQAEGWSF